MSVTFPLCNPGIVLQGFSSCIRRLTQNSIPAVYQNCRRQFSRRPTRKKSRYKVPRYPPESRPQYNFVGREADLKKLWDSLCPQSPHPRRIVVLHGQDGVGKTRLAAHFAQIHAPYLRNVLWIDGRDKNSVLASLAAVAPRLPTDDVISAFTRRVPGGSVIEQEASIVLKWLAKKEHAKWLLIFDHIAPQEGRIPGSAGYDLYDFLPRADHGKVLVISRFPCTIGAEESHQMQLRPMSLQESLGIFDEALEGRPVDGRSVEAKKILVRQVEGSPLALTQAASYIRHTGLSISSYLQLYLEERRRPQATVSHSRDASLITCALSFKELEQSNPVAAKLVLLLSCYHNTRIPLDLLNYVRDSPDAPEWLMDANPREQKVTQGIQKLRNFSFIEDADYGRFCTIHPQVQRWCRTNMDEKEQEQLNSIALTTLGMAATRALEGGTLARRQSLLPHVDEMRRLLQSGGPVLSNTRTLTAINILASLYEKEGHLKDAESMYLLLLPRSTELLGRYHRSTRHIVRALRRLRFLQGRYGQLVASRWWAPILLRGLELLSGLSMIIVGVWTGLIFLIIAFFVYLLARFFRIEQEDALARQTYIEVEKSQDV
ncbi:P-loop containing nucleoside triphosphate hydrolase protein [Aspergillus lucknowensis]|uniref:P-loop containing nucleoside triphosphate hydrolase protein n=1 Tax=Aspergillus lucknowensis TaxID=176173 RepID=A0ABR4LS84_9EURO